MRGQNLMRAIFSVVLISIIGFETMNFSYLSTSTMFMLKILAMKLLPVPVGPNAPIKSILSFANAFMKSFCFSVIGFIFSKITIVLTVHYRFPEPTSYLLDKKITYAKWRE